MKNTVGWKEKGVQRFLYCVVLLFLCIPSTGCGTQQALKGEKPEPSDRFTPALYEEAHDSLPAASASRLPPWRGVNFLNRFSFDWSNRPFIEQDFACVSSLGFNFVRLPLDYRTWTSGTRSGRYRESVLANLDDAIRWGHQHGVHVQLNLHRAPGYCVNSPAEKLNLWKDDAAQEAFVNQWSMFARRYRGIPSRFLSFNLLNEPAAVDEHTYSTVMRMAIDAIRQEDPNRLIVVDGLDYAHTPVWELVNDGVAQSLHQYQPFGLTHYKASWITGSDLWPVPQWPIQILGDKLYGSYKNDLCKPFIIHGDFETGAEIFLGVAVVSSFLEIQVQADGQTIDEYRLASGPGKGDWEKVVYNAEWGIYQNIFNREYRSNIPPGTTEIAIIPGEGDWLSLTHIRVAYPDGSSVRIQPTSMDWGLAPSPVQIHTNRTYSVEESSQYNRDRLQRQLLDPWLELAKRGVGIMVGEWGVYYRTPHRVSLDWMQDNLALFREAGLGWALWEFRGSFGVLDSGRPDVSYETTPCGALDRLMLDQLLQ